MITFASGGPDDLLARMLEQGWGAIIANLPRYERTRFDRYDLHTSEPYRVSYRSVADIERGELADENGRHAWRATLLAGETALAVLEADSDHRPVAVHTGPAKDGISHAFAVANGMPASGFLSLVESPALKFCAAMLQPEGDTPGEAMFIPYAPDQTGLARYEPLPGREVLARLQALARQIRAGDEGETPAGG